MTALKIAMPDSTIPNTNADEQVPNELLEPFLIDRRALAAFLSVSVPTIDRMKAAGKLPQSIRIAGSIRWERQEIEAWLRRRKPDGTLLSLEQWRIVWESLQQNKKC